MRSYRSVALSFVSALSGMWVLTALCESDANNGQAGSNVATFAVAEQICGVWRLDSDLTEKVNGKRRELGDFVVSSDPAVASVIPDRVKTVIPHWESALLMTGHVEFLGKKHPCCIVAIRGAIHLVYFRPKGLDPLGDSESRYLVLVWGTTPADDVLFIGGDFANKKFSAFKRRPISE